MSINEQVEQKAYELGFGGVYFVHSSLYNKDLVILMYPYRSFSNDEYIPAYYLASNKSFHALKKLIAELNYEGVNAQNANVLLKQTAQAAGLGLIGKNDLLHTDKFGSRMVLYALEVEGIQTQSYNLPTQNMCRNCTACIKACPTGAITQEGFLRDKCMRQYMDAPPYPDFVQKNIRTYLGCEVCMQVCPYNSAIEKVKVADDIRDALLPSRIIAGDVKAAKDLFGKNIKTRRLVADAEAIVKNGLDKK